MAVLTWLGFQPKQSEAQSEPQDASRYLITGGVEISASSAVASSTPLHLESGARLALVGNDTFRKHYFCDWILGFVDVPGSRVEFKVGDKPQTAGPERANLASLLGRSPFLYGETIRESLPYRTNHVRKQDLYALIERLYGPSLRARTSPQNPLVDAKGEAVSTAALTAREHLEIAQINVILQKTPLVLLDLSSELMSEALNEGFRPSDLLLQSGKTIVVILPPTKNLAWAEEILGVKFSSSLNFS